MRVLIVAVGSRGDVAPYTGLGAGLTAAGHEVTLAAHPPFEGVVRAAGLEFTALPGDVRALTATPEDGGRPSPLFLARRVGLLTRYLREAALGALAAAEAGVDIILFNSSARTSRRGWASRPSACSPNQSQRPARSLRSWPTRGVRWAGGATGSPAR
jgi:UDP:flavonoid glycosyltransferase YjiC (YdhE family)